MNMVINDISIGALIKNRYQEIDLNNILNFLNGARTFDFPMLPTGLFPAAGASAAAIAGGYTNVWVRDNIYVALAHAVAGRLEVTVGVLYSIAEFYLRHPEKMMAIVRGEADRQSVESRPHVRFDGSRLAELSERWAHAQNDALGYFLWLYAREARAGHLKPNGELLALFALYFAAIRYWQDEDSGHWEERRKVEASSIGAVVAGLRELRGLLLEAGTDCRFDGVRVTPDMIDALIEPGALALAAILPAECVQPDPLKRRRYDAALLFLSYPLDVVDDGLSDRIVADVLENLKGDYGIRRYIGDSYWTADYKDKVPPGERTIDVSHGQERRDALGRPGQEAQWCIFDPILSIIAGQRYFRTQSSDDLDRQVYHLNRSLGQITRLNGGGGTLVCPEAYYLERGCYRPNDHVPLLWTQANLWIALFTMQNSVALAA